MKTQIVKRLLDNVCNVKTITVKHENINSEKGNHKR